MVDATEVLGAGVCVVGDALRNLIFLHSDVTSDVVNPSFLDGGSKSSYSITKGQDHRLVSHTHWLWCDLRGRWCRCGKARDTAVGRWLEEKIVIWVRGICLEGRHDVIDVLDFFVAVTLS